MRPLCFHPGESWLYGLSCDVLGAVIVVITGMSLGDYMQVKIFQPLGMDDTAFRMPTEKSGRIATIYTDGPQGVVPRKSRAAFEMVDDRKIEAGGAGLISTADDYTRFALMLMNGGTLDGIRILSEASVREMSRNHLDERQMLAYNAPNNIGYGYGLAMRVMINPDKSEYLENVGAFGWNGAAGTTVRIDPVLRRTVVFGIQRMPANHADFIPSLLKAVHETIHD
jgi:CubicO group peptidase (beta-lactamase class C family)